MIKLPFNVGMTTCELDVDPIIQRAFEAGIDMGIAKPGDRAVLIAGTPTDSGKRAPNVMRLVEVK